MLDPKWSSLDVRDPRFDPRLHGMPDWPPLRNPEPKPLSYVSNGQPCFTMTQDRQRGAPDRCGLQKFRKLSYQSVGVGDGRRESGLKDRRDLPLGRLDRPMEVLLNVWRRDS